MTKPWKKELLSSLTRGELALLPTAVYHEFVGCNEWLSRLSEYDYETFLLLCIEAA